MSLPKTLAIVALMLFLAIGIGAIFKKGKTKSTEIMTKVNQDIPVEVELSHEIQVISLVEETVQKNKEEIAESRPMAKETKLTNIKSWPLSSDQLPEDNRIEELFNKTEPRLPFVETITYQSRVAWQKGRPAWLSDYASHYQTSRHFIARSLNGKPDYFKQDIADGDRFNVLRLDKSINFYLLVDISRNKMWFYAYDTENNERTLIKTYRIGLGRLDSTKSSGLLTPLGKYKLGSKIAIYKPKMMGLYNGQKVEMIRVFGSRWIPFEKEISENSTTPIKGFGLHGVPWIENDKGSLAEDSSTIGKYESDGCIRMLTADMEELFAIIITKPTFMELVNDFSHAKLPGMERMQIAESRK
jgi:hypothetical protein